MPLETASYISDLEPSNPVPTDGLGQADDHMRLIKATLKATFPKITGALSVTQDDLNAVANTKTALDDLKAHAIRDDRSGAITGSLVVSGALNGGVVQQGGATLVPRGIIALWAGYLADVPAGWLLCNGTNGTPDLRDRFIVGAGNSYGVGAAGGNVLMSTTTTAAGQHSHGGATWAGGNHSHTGTTDAQGLHGHGGITSATSLTVEHLPPHNHYFGTEGAAGTDPDGIPAPDSPRSYADGNGPKMTTSSTGSGAPHTHSIAQDGNHAHNLQVNASGEHAHGITADGNHAHTVQFDNRPPFFALAYIMKN